MVIAAFIGVIAVCYVIELFVSPPDWHLFAFHTVVPQLAGPDSVVLAVGIIGATVMPHAIYLHSSLTQGRVPVRTDAERRRIIGYSQSRGADRPRRRRPGEHGDAGDGRLGVP